MHKKVDTGVIILIEFRARIWSLLHDRTCN